jgi:hypothetical protein
MDRLPRIVSVGRKLLEQPFSSALYDEATADLEGLCSIDADTAPLLRALAHEADVERDGILGGGEVRRHLSLLGDHLKAATKAALSVTAARERQAEHADWRPGTAGMVQAQERWSRGGALAPWGQEAAE